MQGSRKVLVNWQEGLFQGWTGTRKRSERLGCGIVRCRGAGLCEGETHLGQRACFSPKRRRCYYPCRGMATSSWVRGRPGPAQYPGHGGPKKRDCISGLLGGSPQRASVVRRTLVLVPPCPLPLPTRCLELPGGRSGGVCWEKVEREREREKEEAAQETGGIK